MKILHLTTWKEMCGIAGYAKDLTTALDSCGIVNEVCPISRNDKKYLSRAEWRQFLAEYCNDAKGYDLAHIQHEFGFFDGLDRLYRSISNFSYLLAGLWKQNQPTIVTFHTEPTFMIPLRGLLSMPQSFIFKMKQYVFSYFWRRKVSTYFSGRKSLFRAVVHSRKTRLALIESGFSPDNIRVISLGVKPRQSSYDGHSKEEAKALLGYPPDTILLSLFGFVAAYKGHENAIRALKRLPDNYHLAIIGGPHPENVTDKTINKILAMTLRNESLKNRVRITGYADADTVDKYHAATDMCIAPYKDLGLSSSAALTWALSSGKPTIATRIPAFSEINHRAECMVMVTPESPLELAWQVERLANDHALQNRLVDNARRYVERHSWDAVSKETQAVYEELLETHGRLKTVGGTAGPGLKMPAYDGLSQGLPSERRYAA